MRNRLFQEQALERLSSPEQLDRLMPLTSPRGWLALFGIGLLLLAGLLWSILGTVETTIKADGVFSAPGAIRVAQSPDAGTLMSVVVKPGDNVQEGEVLAIIDSKPLTSPVTGRVLDSANKIGSILSAGAPVVSLEISEAELGAVAFVPAAVGYRVRPGMPVNIIPASDDPQSATHLSGVVKSVGRMPATQVTVHRHLQNETWTTSTLAVGPVIQVDIEFAELKASDRIFCGLPCSAQIVVERQRPIELVLPRFSRNGSE